MASESVCKSVWQHFSKTSSNKDKIKCGLCDIDIDNKGGSTSSAIRHLHRKHGITISTSSKSNDSKMRKREDDDGDEVVYSKT